MMSRLKTILIVDDGDDERELLAELLEFCGYPVLVAVNGLEGLGFATAKSPDLILMDIRMPMMDGLEATRRLKALEETRSIPVIVLTSGFVDVEAERTAYEAGCDGFETKPINDLDAFLQKIEQHLQ